MADTEPSSERKREYITSFSNVSQEEAEVILGFRFGEFYYSQIPIEQFITATAPEELKKKIFKRLIDCIESEGFPEASISPMNEAVVTDNVGIILITMVSHCKRTMNRNDLILSRKKQIIGEDEQVSGKMEFVIIQQINAGNTRYVIVVEVKREILGKGLTQLLLSLKSMWEINNDHKLVYGFLTTAIDWQLVTYDGRTWKLSEPSSLLLGNMGKQEDRWLKNYTQILDIIYSILLSI
jgi:hypothetical protein